MAGAGVYVTSYNGANVELSMSNNMIVENKALQGSGIYLISFTNGATISGYSGK